MLIHTFEVSSQLTSKKFFDIQKELKQQSNCWDGRSKNTMIYYGLCDRGIRILFQRIQKKDFTQYQVHYIISAQRVLEPENYVGLFDPGDYDKLERKTNKILSKACKELPPLQSCWLSRLDYCINAYLDSQEQVKEYIKLARRCRIPKTMDRFYLRDKKGRKKLSKDDMTLRNREYVAVSIYNKYAELKKEQKREGMFPDIADAEPIVRIEIRCMNDKLNQLAQKFKLSGSIRDFISHTEEISDYLYRYYLSRMFPAGQFYTLAEARERIEYSGFKKENKDDMLELLKRTSDAHSLDEAIKYWSDTYGKRLAKRLLCMFDLIDTNPITLTGEMKKVFGEDNIPHPNEFNEDSYNIL